jgi:hypothetical protein
LGRRWSWGHPSALSGASSAEKAFSLWRLPSRVPRCRPSGKWGPSSRRHWSEKGQECLGRARVLCVSVLRHLTGSRGTPRGRATSAPAAWHSTLLARDQPTARAAAPDAGAASSKRKSRSGSVALGRACRTPLGAEIGCSYANLFTKRKIRVYSCENVYSRSFVTKFRGAGAVSLPRLQWAGSRGNRGCPTQKTARVCHPIRDYPSSFFGARPIPPRRPQRDPRRARTRSGFESSRARPRAVIG